jgi:hypothetical protein
MFAVTTLQIYIRDLRCQLNNELFGLQCRPALCRGYKPFSLVKFRTTICPDRSGFGGLVVSMLASGTRVRGFKPGRSRRSFSDEKILSMPSFGSEVKPFAPCRRFAAC